MKRSSRIDLTRSLARTFILVCFLSLLASASETRAQQITVLSRNLYLGADILMLFTDETCPQELPDLTKNFYDVVRSTKYPERAKAFAKEIAAHQPDLVGLQEVFRYQIRSFSDSVANPVNSDKTAAEFETLDFLDILMKELEDRRLRYTIVAESINSNEVLPVRNADSADGRQLALHITDRDVILARAGLETANPAAKNFTAHLAPFLPHRDCPGAKQVSFKRGYAAIDVKIAGQSLRFANTHLEGSSAAPVQRQQATQLVAELSQSRIPVVLVGDINSDPCGCAGEAYTIITASNFIDTFEQVQPGGTSPTCCEDANLANCPSKNYTRIDFIFYRGALTPLSFERFGVELKDRTPSKLWPSDHAGIVATLSPG